jgi:hypothetical protein
MLPLRKLSVSMTQPYGPTGLPALISCEEFKLKDV